MGGGLAHSRLCFRDCLNSYLQALTSCLCNLACLSFRSQLPIEMAHRVPVGSQTTVTCLRVIQTSLRLWVL